VYYRSIVRDSKTHQDESSIRIIGVQITCILYMAWLHAVVASNIHEIGGKYKRVGGGGVCRQWPYASSVRYTMGIQDVDLQCDLAHFGFRVSHQGELSWINQPAGRYSRVTTQHCRDQVSTSTFRRIEADSALSLSSMRRTPR